MENVIEKHHKTMNEKMRDNWPILEQACGNAGLIKKCVQIPQDAGHLTGLNTFGEHTYFIDVGRLAFIENNPC